MNDFEKMSGSVLREYARDIGVRAPTTMRKKDLIVAIKDVLNGKTKPYYSKRGRPVLTNTLLKSDDASVLEKIQKLDKAWLCFREEIIKIIIE